LGLSHKGKAGEGFCFINTLPDCTADLRTLHAGRPPRTGEKWVFTQFIRDCAVVPGTSTETTAGFPTVIYAPIGRHIGRLRSRTHLFRGAWAAARPAVQPPQGGVDRFLASLRTAPSYRRSSVGRARRNSRNW